MTNYSCAITVGCKTCIVKFFICGCSLYILLSTDCNAFFPATGAMSPDDISLTGSFDFMDELTEVESMGFPD